MNAKLIIPFLVLVLAACGGDGGGGGNRGSGDSGGDDDDGSGGAVDPPVLTTSDWEKHVYVGSTEALEQEMAIDSVGNVMAIWRQWFWVDEPWSEQPNAAYIRAGEEFQWRGLETEGIMSSDTNFAAYRMWNLEAKFDSNDHAIFAYAHYRIDSDQTQLRVNRFIPGSGWQAAHILQELSGSIQIVPRLAMLPSGGLIAIWGNKSDETVWTSSYSTADGWTLPVVQIAGATEVAETSVDLAGDASGNAIAVWQRVDNDLMDVVTSRYTAVSGWSAPMRLEEGLTDMDAGDPKVGLDSDGNGIAVWEAENKIYFNRYTPDGGWSEAELLAEGSKAQLAVSAGGSAIVIWHESEDLRAAVFSPASGWSEPATLDIRNSEVTEGQIAINDSGNAVAVWTQLNGTVKTVWSNHYRVASGWSGPGLVEVLDSGAASYPEVIIDNDGNAVAIWYMRQDDDYYTSIHISRYINN